MRSGKSLCPSESQEVFPDHAAHKVAYIYGVNAVAELTLKTVAVQQGHEELEIFLFSVMWRGRQQEKMTRDSGRISPSLRRAVFRNFASQMVALILWASSQTIKSQSVVFNFS